MYPACCGRYLEGAQAAPTAQALMRSRYTAFARADADYLLRTWAAQHRPARLDLEESVRWQRLVVLDTQAGGPFDDTGVVEFEAWYRQDGRPGHLHEISDFRREGGQWRYVGPRAQSPTPGR